MQSTESRIQRYHVLIAFFSIGRRLIRVVAWLRLVLSFCLRKQAKKRWRAVLQLLAHRLNLSRRSGHAHCCFVCLCFLIVKFCSHREVTSAPRVLDKARICLRGWLTFMTPRGEGVCGRFRLSECEADGDLRIIAGDLRHISGWSVYNW